MRPFLVKYRQSLMDVITAVIAVVALFLAWSESTFGGDATFGGYGAGPQANTEWWATPLLILGWVIAAALLAARLYARGRRQR